MDTLCLPARIESLAQFRDFVFRKLSEGKVAESFYPKIELVLEEVLTNVFKYAYEDGPGEAELACELQGGLFRLRVTDRGSQFNPLASPEPDLTDDISERTVGGLGIYFVREMVDDIAYERRGGRNILTMSIKISP
jgi:serine/threonine-protein kinase RsbW